MFSLFTKKEKVLGLDIRDNFIRYVKVSRSENDREILDFGEEKIASLEPRNALMSALQSIVRKTKTKNAIVSIPSDGVSFEIVKMPKVSEGDVLTAIRFSLTERLRLSHGQNILFYEFVESINTEDVYRVVVSPIENIAFLKSVFENSGVNVLRFVSQSEALVRSCVKDGTMLPSMALDINSDISVLGLMNPFETVPHISFEIDKNRIHEVVSDVYVDFYKKNEQKIGYIWVTGEFAKEENFLNLLSRQTRLPIEQGDIFVNIKENTSVHKMIKDESFLYAVAIGLAIS